MKKYEIYQMSCENTKTRNLLFRPYEEIAPLDVSLFDKVYSGVLKVDHKDFNEDIEYLMTLFYIFNMEKPADFKGRSLSVGDIVKLNDLYYYVQPVGWKLIDGLNI